MSVALVLVSHSATLATGLAELARQMAGDVEIVPAGGLPDGGIGTSYDLVEESVTGLRDGGHEVLLLSDLGSATMTIEAVIDILDDEKVAFADAPFVEAAVAAAVAAQGGRDLAACHAAAMAAITPFVPAGSDEPAEQADDGPDGESYARDVVVADEAGLHARPAAKIADMAGPAGGAVLINDVEADSIMSVMALGVANGETVTVSGPAEHAAIIDQIADGIAAGLD